MDYSNLTMLYQEGGLIAVFLILLIYDIFGSEQSKRWFSLTACVLLGVQTLAGFIPHATGEAFGGMYRSSEMTVLMKSILNIATLAVFAMSARWLRKDPSAGVREGEFYVVTLATLLGMYLMISAGNMMMLYIGIETASLPLACLVAYNKYRAESAEAGAKYILISALSSGVMMFGMSFLYGALGTMYFDGMAAAMSVNYMTVIGFVFFFAGLAFKISLVPFHLWTPDVYEGAPTSVTAYLSVVSKAAACFALLFTLYGVFGAIEQVWRPIMWALTVATIIVGNLFAIRQKDIKRFFAFSSISQAGYILLGIMTGTPEGMAATVYYVLVYLFANMAVFGVIAAVENATGRTDIASLNGLRRSSPMLTFVMMAAVFSLAGIPPFGGFFSKFAIFYAAAAGGEYLLVFIALVNTVVSLYYYLLIIKAMFINPGEENRPLVAADNYIKTTLIVCTAATLVIGLFGGLFGHIGSISFGI